MHFLIEPGPWFMVSSVGRMKKLTQRQKLFLFLYPVGHCVLAVLVTIAAFASLNMDGPPSRHEEIMGTIYNYILHVLVPSLFLGLRVPDTPVLQWVLVALPAMIYACVFLLAYKVIRKR